jgi:hypothetical protein
MGSHLPPRVSLELPIEVEPQRLIEGIGVEFDITAH